MKDFCGRYMRNETFHGDYRGADFSCASLAGARFFHVDCRGANFQGATLNDVKFERSDFRGADFRWADFYGAILNNVILDGANFGHAYGILILGPIEIKGPAEPVYFVRHHDEAMVWDGYFWGTVPEWLKEVKYRAGHILPIHNFVADSARRWAEAVEY